MRVSGSKNKISRNNVGVKCVRFEQTKKSRLRDRLKMNRMLCRYFGGRSSWISIKVWFFLKAKLWITKYIANLRLLISSPLTYNPPNR